MPVFWGTASGWWVIMHLTRMQFTMLCMKLFVAQDFMLQRH